MLRSPRSGRLEARTTSMQPMPSPQLYALLAVLGLLVIPLGAWRGWRFVRVFWWRALHLAILALVAVQAVLDQVCVLTAWQAALERAAGAAASDAPFIAGFINRLIFWPLPIWVF